MLSFVHGRCRKCGYTAIAFDSPRGLWCPICSMFGSGKVVRMRVRPIRDDDVVVCDYRKPSGQFAAGMAFAVSKGFDVDAGLARFEEEWEKVFGPQ